MSRGKLSELLRVYVYCSKSMCLYGLKIMQLYCFYFYGYTPIACLSPSPHKEKNEKKKHGRVQLYSPIEFAGDQLGTMGERLRREGGAAPAVGRGDVRPAVGEIDSAGGDMTVGEQGCVSGRLLQQAGERACSSWEAGGEQV